MKSQAANKGKMKNKVFILSVIVLLSCGKKEEKQSTEHLIYTHEPDTQNYHIKELDKILSLGDSAMKSIEQKKQNMKKVNDRMSHQVENAQHLVDIYRDSIYKMESKPNTCDKCIEMQKRNIAIKDSFIYNISYIDTSVYLIDTIYDTIILPKKVNKKRLKKNKK